MGRADLQLERSCFIGRCQRGWIAIVRLDLFICPRIVPHEMVTFPVTRYKPLIIHAI